MSNGVDPDQDRPFVGPFVVLPVLIRVQTICECYEQITKARER